MLRFLSATDMEAGFDGEGLNPAKHPRDDIIVTMFVLYTMYLSTCGVIYVAVL